MDISDLSKKLTVAEFETDEFGRVVIDDAILLDYVSGAAFEIMMANDNTACNSNGACGNAGCANVASCK
jgi:hypothetical protein